MRRVFLLSMLMTAVLTATTPTGTASPGGRRGDRQTPVVVGSRVTPAPVPTTARPQPPSGAAPRATDHPPIPTQATDYWLVPAAAWSAGTPSQRAAAIDLGRAFALIAGGESASALPLINTRTLAGTPLAAHALYARGAVELQQTRYRDARASLSAARDAQPETALADRAAWSEGDAAELAGDFRAAADAFAAVRGSRTLGAERVLHRLAKAATSAGDAARANEAWRTLYFDHPASPGGDEAAELVSGLGLEPLVAGSARLDAELARVDRLIAATRYREAGATLIRLVPIARGDAADLVALRLAQCDAHQRRHAKAVERLQALAPSEARRAEVAYTLATALRALGRHDRYVETVRRLVANDPVSPWTERALDGLASHYIIIDEDAEADAVFRELLKLFPSGRPAERAAWLVGWAVLKQGRGAEAATLFDWAATSFPRSDYRPRWIYWAGYGYERDGQSAQAGDRYTLAVVDYANSYYGRLAGQRLKDLRLTPEPAHVALQRFQDEPHTPLAIGEDAAELIRWLLVAGLWDAAIDEIQRLQADQRHPILDATRAWALNRKGDLRAGITAMRRAYPHALAAGGEQLPVDLQRIVFPLEYWPLIREQAGLHGLDPFLVAALVAQESTFDPAARSKANAIGLMQIIPTTGRTWARKLGIKPFRTSSLTNATINARIGAAYFADLAGRLGGTHFALAAYNAGPSRVVRWKGERPGVSREMFIDDIPFFETQNYVKRILGTAEDYRRLYGSR